MKTTHTYILIVLILLFNACSSSTDSNGNVNTTPVPLAPSNLTAYAFSPTTIILNWTDNSTNEIGFKIERKTGSGAYAVIASTTISDDTTFNDVGLTPNTTYSYRVKAYNAGGNSISYSNEFTLSNQGVTDIDGNFYELVTIGTQTWTKRNLTVSHYRNGDAINYTYQSNLCDLDTWSNYQSITTSGQADGINNGQIYGKLYSIKAVTDSRGLAPAGFHIPTKAEWEQLVSYLDPNCNTSSGFGSEIAGNKLKEVGTAHWLSPNGTNSTGFTALPGGLLESGFYGMRSSAYWWGSTLDPNYKLYFVALGDINTYNQFASGYSNGACYSLSVRCIKD